MKIKRINPFIAIDSTLVCLISVVILAPVLNIFASSFASNRVLAEGNFIFFPKELTLDNYIAVFKDVTIWHAYLISVLKTVIGVVTHVFFCSMVAFGLSKRDLKFRNLYTVMGVITLFFSGGMIPTYLLMKKLGLLNNFMVYILPQLFSYYDVVILMNFFRQVPSSLEESASMDGAGVWRIFLQIILPLSKPALATIALFNGVYQWNDFMTAKLYMTKESLYPVQMKLYEIIVQQQAASMNTIGNVALQTTSKGIQLATIVVTTVPILIIYPMLQKHFVSGMMLGAVKE
ncbi:carbohydrate ABC transporter permease [Butyrivibrio sp. WCD3002]|jgi:putative aldouronate transport system permease protein|uniref:carbohydrate ABC transporter permease n=1 Tax=Butyrivibrio sp. WCD3002 TaxID=1280676 RepID=UPI000419BCA9|nr:carbohydrate ABC transporter permease [Butyrivibrio sp. WCD3002]